MPRSLLPDELRDAGYDVVEAGEGERILPSAIVERFTTNADRALVPLIAGSTRRVASTVTHAGICKVKRYTFALL
jgi:hypothetical protein